MLVLNASVAQDMSASGVRETRQMCARRMLGTDLPGWRKRGIPKRRFYGRNKVRHAWSDRNLHKTKCAED